MPGLETADTLGYDTHRQAAISSGSEFQPCSQYAAPCARRVQASSRAARHPGSVSASPVADGQSVEASQARARSTIQRWRPRCRRLSMPRGAARSEARGRPPFGFSASDGRSGSTTARRSSDPRASRPAQPPHRGFAPRSKPAPCRNPSARDPRSAPARSAPSRAGPASRRLRPACRGRRRRRASRNDRPPRAAG